MSRDDLALRIRTRFARDLAPPVVKLVPLVVEGQVAGRLTTERVRRIARFDRIFHADADRVVLSTSPDTPLVRSTALAEVTRTLASEGALTAWRGELYAVAPAFGSAPWFRVERAAARYFGIRTHAAHVNGLVRDGDAISMWVARRSPTKAIDPGLLDNLVGGGIAADTSVAATVIKESWEEAGIPETIAREARCTGTLRVVRLLPDGLQDEILFVHDLWLPPGFVPANQDGEAGGHARLTLEDVAGVVSCREGPEAMTVDASLVALAALLREGAFDGDAEGRASLFELLQTLAAPM